MCNKWTETKSSVQTEHSSEWVLHQKVDHCNHKVQCLIAMTFNYTHNSLRIGTFPCPMCGVCSQKTRLRSNPAHVNIWGIFIWIFHLHAGPSTPLFPPAPPSYIFMGCTPQILSLDVRSVLKPRQLMLYFVNGMIYELCLWCKVFLRTRWLVCWQCA